MWRVNFRRKKKVNYYLLYEVVLDTLWSSEYYSLEDISRVNFLRKLRRLDLLCRIFDVSSLCLIMIVLFCRFDNFTIYESERHKVLVPKCGKNCNVLGFTFILRRLLSPWRICGFLFYRIHRRSILQNVILPVVIQKQGKEINVKNRWYPYKIPNSVNNIKQKLSS